MLRSLKRGQKCPILCLSDSICTTPSLWDYYLSTLKHIEDLLEYIRLDHKRRNYTVDKNPCRFTIVLPSIIVKNVFRMWVILLFRRYTFYRNLSFLDYNSFQPTITKGYKRNTLAMD